MTLGRGGAHRAVRAHTPAPGAHERLSAHHRFCLPLPGSQSQAEDGGARVRVPPSPRGHHAAPEEAEDQRVQGAQVRRVRLHHGEPAAVPRPIHSLPLHMHSPPRYQRPPPEGYIFYIDEPPSTHHYHPKSIVHIRVHSWCRAFCRFGWKVLYVPSITVLCTVFSLTSLKFLLETVMNLQSNDRWTWSCMKT